MWGKRHCRCTTPDGTPSIRTPSGVFSCYPLMARSKAREESCPYSPECVEGGFCEVRRSKRPLRHCGKHLTTARWAPSEIETERLPTIPSYELPEE